MSFFVELLKEFVTAWREGNWRTRAAIGISALLIVWGGFLTEILDASIGARDLGRFLLGLGTAIGLAIFAIQKTKEEVKREKKIEAVEKRVQENPKEPQVAWELARVKLESYLNRNLSQVRSIFLLTLLVMAVGFALILVGAYRGFVDPDHFRASILSSVSGVVVTFIGGTFLVLYKSTMAQAKDYVTILERINAVGMSVQILDSLEDTNGDLKDETTAAIARQLLHRYSQNMPEVSSGPRASKRRSGGSSPTGQ